MRKILAMLLALALLLPAGAALAETYPLVEEPITVTGVVIRAEGVGEPRLTWTALEEVTGIHVDWTAVESDAFAVYLAAGECRFLPQHHGSGTHQRLWRARRNVRGLHAVPGHHAQPLQNF